MRNQVFLALTGLCFLLGSTSGFASFCTEDLGSSSFGNLFEARSFIEQGIREYILAPNAIGLDPVRPGMAEVELEKEVIEFYISDPVFQRSPTLFYILLHERGVRRSSSRAQEFMFELMEGWSGQLERYAEAARVAEYRPRKGAKTFTTDFVPEAKFYLNQRLTSILRELEPEASETQLEINLSTVYDLFLADPKFKKNPRQYLKKYITPAIMESNFARQHRAAFELMAFLRRSSNEAIESLVGRDLLLLDPQPGYYRQPFSFQFK